MSVSIIYFLLEGILAFINTENDNQFGMNFKPANETNIDSLETLNPSNFLNLESYEDTIRAKQLGLSFYFTEKELDNLPILENYTKRGSLYYEYYYRSKTEHPEAALDTLNHRNTFTHRWLYSRAITWYKIIHNPTAFVDYISTKIPFFLFFFTPFYALIFWLIYSHKKYNYIEHVIFIFHIFSFLFLAMILFRIPALIFDTDFLQVICF